MNIEFGCGANPTYSDFKTCDIRNLPGVDFVCPAWDIDKHVEANSVSTIFSRHFFEHLTFVQGETVLQVWHNILKPGGRIDMILPNMTYHVNQWISGKNMEHAKAGFWGWQREGETETWDIHKSGYNKDSLFELVLKKGFIDPISHKKPGNKHLHISCFKPQP